MKEKLFNGDFIKLVKTKASRVKDWVVENPELALVGGALGSYGIIIVDALLTSKNSRNCERKRTTAYINRLERD